MSCLSTNCLPPLCSFPTLNPKVWLTCAMCSPTSACPTVLMWDTETLALVMKVVSFLTNHSCGSISNFIILGFGQFNHELGNLMINIHHAENGGTVVCYGDIAVLIYHHLVQP